MGHQRSLLVSLRPHGNSSMQQAGIVYLRGRRVYVKEVDVNSFVGKANYYGTHVVQKKKVLRVAGKRS